MKCEDVKEYVSKKLENLILNDDLWIEVEQFCFLSEQISDCVTKFESDKSCLSHVPVAFKEISDHLRANLPYATLSLQDEDKIMNLVIEKADSALRLID